MIKPEKAQPLARTFFGLTGKPVFSTAEVAACAGIKENTLRQWVKRNHVELRFSERPGPGRALLFSANDLLEIMAFAELSRLGISPSRFSGSLSADTLASMVLATSMNKIRELAGEWGDWRPEWTNQQRYVLSFFDPSHEIIDWTVLNEPFLSPQSSNIATWLTIDCLALALRALEWLQQKTAGGVNGD